MLYNLDLGYLFNLISCLDDTPSASLSACVQGTQQACFHVRASELAVSFLLECPFLDPCGQLSPSCT